MMVKFEICKQGKAANRKIQPVSASRCVAYPEQKTKEPSNFVVQAREQWW